MRKNRIGTYSYISYISRYLYYHVSVIIKIELSNCVIKLSIDPL